MGVCRLDPRLREVVEKCDKWIDPLRKALFEVIVADSIRGDWDEMIERLFRALWLLDRSLEMTRTINMEEYAKTRSWLEQLQIKAGVRDMEGWNMIVARVVPSLIDMVFAKYAECVTSRGQP
jgi:hypothetical protein